ncbi:transcription factor bHLH168-like [Vitis riparia]|uniref:transcription factor bHLH168-like n=1 Tax=Vitis riparia TaxID=96939 RepID=UPI00155A7F77|nr:transcription factor bHLH168-like [Vitis riparia]
MALLEAEDSLEKQGIKKLAKKGSMTRRASNSPKLHRNEIEKNRRMSMKDLYARLAFQIPTAPSKSSLHLLLEHATTHVKRLQQRLKMLKQKKQLLEGRTHHITGSSRSPVIIVREMGSILEVFLTSGLNKNFFLYEVISVLEEEAAQVVTANQSTVGDRIIYSICSQAVSSRIGIETSRVRERLQELIS